MKRLLVAIALILTCLGLMAVEISPKVNMYHVFGDTNVLIIPDDTVYSKWMAALGDYSGGLFAHSWEGDGSGSVDTLKFEYRVCNFSRFVGQYLVPDTIYAEAWDTLVVATDSTSHIWLADLTAGWRNYEWVQVRAFNHESDSATLEKCKFIMAGSK